MASRKPRSKIDPTKSEDIRYLYQYFVDCNRTKKQRESTTAIYQKVAKILHVGVTTVLRCVKNKTDDKATKDNTYKLKKIDDFSQEVIRRKIYKLYEKKTLPTIKLIQNEIKDEINVSDSLLRMTLLRMGFCWRRTTDDRRVIIERTDSKAARARYIRTIKQHRSEGKNIVYLDETWVNAGHTTPFTWLPQLKLVGIGGDSEIVRNLPQIPPGKGKRLIILHAGSENGFVPDMDLVFEGKKSGDYHQEMNTTVFLEWFERLCRALPGPSCIVLDNASYHNARTDSTTSPTSATRKDDMLSWLRNRNIEFENIMTKPELYEIIKRNKPPIIYKTDELAWQWGHTVLRTPVRQCELNPIELVWAQVKHFVAKGNTTYRMSDVKKLVEDGLESITPEKWKKCCDHVIELENYYTKSERITQAIEPVIIHLDSDVESSDNDEEESENENSDVESSDDDDGEEIESEN